MQTKLKSKMYKEDKYKKKIKSLEQHNRFKAINKEYDSRVFRLIDQAKKSRQPLIKASSLKKCRK
jgi:hypothetical protein